MKRQPTGLSKEVTNGHHVSPRALILGTHTGHCPCSPQDLAEVCKRDGTERDDKDVDRVVGLGSSR